MRVTSGLRVDRGPSDGVRMRRVTVPVRDGVRLNASLYIPRSGSECVPVCLEITPYTVDMMHDVGQDLARRGLGYLVVDVRGRGDSEGEFRQFVHDAHDGVDVIAKGTHERFVIDKERFDKKIRNKAVAHAIRT